MSDRLQGEEKRCQRERTTSRDQTPERKVDQRRQPDPFKVAVQDRRPDNGRERKSHVLDRDHDARFEALDCRGLLRLG